GAFNGGEGVFVGPFATLGTYGTTGRIVGGGSYEGAGGTGVEVYGAGLLKDTAPLHIYGGTGAYGGTGLRLDGPGAGFNTGASVALASDAVVTGGAGLYGPLPIGTPGTTFSGPTGSGGIGASVAQGATLALSGSSISGGVGANDANYEAVGGRGGVGVADSGGTVSNAGGLIEGGAGGAGGTYGSGYSAGAGGTGVVLDGGTLQNGTIGAPPDGLYSRIYGGSTSGTGNNYSNGGVGVDVTAAGTLDNLGGYFHSQFGKIIGGATNLGYGGAGILMSAGGHINNDGLVVGGKTGGGDSGGAGIEASGALNGSVFNTAYVINTYQVVGGNSAVSTGGAGLLMDSGSYLKNEGFVTGGNGGIGGAGAIFNESGANNTNTAGAYISGGYGYTGAGGDGVDLASAGSTLLNRGTITGGRAGYNASGGVGVLIGPGADLSNYGVISGGTGSDRGPGGGEVTLAPAVGVDINGGTLFDQGSIRAGSNYFPHTYFSGDAVQFGPVAGGRMLLESGWQLQGDVTGFAAGDTIDITNLAFATAQAQLASTLSPGGGFSTGATGETLQFTGSYTGANQLILTSIDGGAGTEITVACFLRGTRIRTAGGEVAIEELRIGDLVLTHSGALRPIRWIGRRSYPAAVAADNRDVLPVLIRRGALGDNLPRRDLRVSPEHALWIDGMLIPARALINGTSIVHDKASEVTYFHLEFDSHDVIYAEGAPAESFVDDESRLQFDNVAEYWIRYPHARAQPARFCAPRVEDGVALEAVRERLRTFLAAAA
ncbi:MAG TPA: Hint domain-containing protein, partial [Steroidobacteraceae bacterium]|nr:Hint domain-containing protein [Steroidobacteraceae bacterium]